VVVAADEIESPIQLKNFWPGSFFWWSGWVGSGQSSLGLENFPQKSQTFQFFYLWVKKKSCRVKKYLGQSRSSPLLGQNYAQVGSGQGTSLHQSYKNRLKKHFGELGKEHIFNQKYENRDWINHKFRIYPYFLLWSFIVFNFLCQLYADNFLFYFPLSSRLKASSFVWNHWQPTYCPYWWSLYCWSCSSRLGCCCLRLL